LTYQCREIPLIGINLAAGAGVGTSLFRQLSREDFNRLSLEQRMEYMQQLLDDMRKKLDDTREELARSKRILANRGE
jgi:hypothetical protein